MYTIKKIFNGVTDVVEVATKDGVKAYLSTALVHDGMFIIVEWPVKFNGVTLVATDFKAPNEYCFEFAHRFAG